MMMRRRSRIAALTAILTLGASAARAADEWGLENESVETFKGKVVDLACELTGDCVADCGAGKRQFGLLKPDGVLRAAVKGSTEFAGAAIDLSPFCGKEIFVDGLLISSPKATLYFVQYIREKESDPWVKTDRFLAEWTRANGEAEQWFRKDPAVKTLIDEGGVLGLGPDVKPKPQ
jgi:hypothetical protein